MVPNTDTSPDLRYERALRSSGSSTVVTIPPDIPRWLGWNEGDPVEIEVTDAGELVLRNVVNGGEAVNAD